MKYGAHGHELILELKRSQDPSRGGGGTNSSMSVLPAYNDRLVQQCLQDLSLHLTALQDQVEANGGQDKLPSNVVPSILLQKHAIARNKRCLLAYHQHRVSALTKAYWEDCSSSSKEDDWTTVPNLSPAEQEFGAAYERLVQTYVTESGWSDDLRASRYPPQPVDKIPVRVVHVNGDDNGPIVLESGRVLEWTLGAVHHLLVTDAEPFLRNGTLERLSTEEDAHQHPLASSSLTTGVGSGGLS